MPKPLKDIAELPLALCPFCGSSSLIVITGKRSILGKKPDSIKCQGCEALFRIDQDEKSLNFDFVPDPYSFFGDHFHGWVDSGAVARLGALIRTNSPEALSYLSGPSRYIWRTRLILGATGPVDNLEASFEWETEKDAKRCLSETRQIQKQLRLVKRDINAEIKGIRVQYREAAGEVQPGVATALVFGKGASRSLAAAERRDLRAKKEHAIQPYEAIKRAIDGVLLDLDQAKLELQTWIDEHR